MDSKFNSGEYKTKVLVYTLADGETVIAKALIVGGMQRFIDSNFDFKICPDTTILLSVRHLDGALPTFAKYYPWDATDVCSMHVCIQQILSVTDPSTVPGLVESYLASL